MPDGTYQIILHSPMGPKQGAAELHAGEGSILLNLFGRDSLFQGDFVPEYTFKTIGTLKTAASEWAASLEGSVSGEYLTAVLCTEAGDFSMEGILQHEGN